MIKGAGKAFQGIPPGPVDYGGRWPGQTCLKGWRVRSRMDWQAVAWLKARTQSPIFRGFAAESADSISESADSTTDFSKVGRLSLSNMFDMLLVHPVGRRESADGKSKNWSSGYGS